MKKERFMRIYIMVIFAVLLGICLVNIYIKSCNSRKRIEGRSKITIFEFSGETYIADGNLKTIQMGKEKETVMEIQGSVRKTESEKNIIKNMKKIANPITLIAYKDKEVYGFHGGNGFYWKRIKGENYIYIFGFAERKQTNSMRLEMEGVN